MEITPNKRKLVVMVDEARRGDICLPNFQRDFVWTRDEVADLLQSVLSGYFVGSLLLLRTEPERPPFAPVTLRGASPVLAQLAPNWLVLDGQQRLTSLLYALTAPAGLGLKNSKQPRRFFLNLDELVSDPESDDVVFEVTERDWKRDALDQPETQFRRHVLPCTAMLTQEQFFAWRDAYEDWARATDPDEHDRFRTEWRNPWTKAITDFQNFEAPVVELPRIEEGDDLAVGRVCAIFEKLNSTGVALSVYDLLTARLYRDKIDLHGLWDEAVAKHPLLNAWSEGKADTAKLGVLLLRTVALLRDLDPKPRNLINLESKNFAEDWRVAAAAFESAMELVTNAGPDGFGVFKPKWLPGFGPVPVLAALRATIAEKKLSAQARDDLRRWWWCNVFLERYSSAVESKSRRDYIEMVRWWTTNGPEPSVFGEARAVIGASGYSIAGSASNASAVYSGVFCLLAISDARDWAQGEAITLQQLEDHHIFPQGYLKTAGLRPQSDKEEINTILNRTLISDTTNRRILDKAPATYLADNTVMVGDVPALLAPHFVEDEARSRMLAAPGSLAPADVRAVYDEFKKAREATIIARIRKACGIE